MLIIILIILFFILLSYQIFLAYKCNLKEGMNQYQPYNTNDPNNVLILAQQNAGNIEFLKSRVDDLSKIKETVDDLSQQVKALNVQVEAMVQQQAEFAQNIAGPTPATITGT